MGSTLVAGLFAGGCEAALRRLVVSNLASLSAHWPRASDGATSGSEEVSRRKLDVVRAAAEPLQALVESLRAKAVQVGSIGQAAHVLFGLLRAQQRFVKTVATKTMPGIAELLESSGVCAAPWTRSLLP